MDNEEIVSKQHRVQGVMKEAYVDGEIVVGVSDGCIVLTECRLQIACSRTKNISIQCIMATQHSVLK